MIRLIRQLRLFTFALVAAPAALQAQYSCGRSFEFQFLPMNIWGDDIMREYISGQSGFVLDSGVITAVAIFNEKRVPVAIASGRGISFRTDFVRSVGKRCEWFLGARAWLFSGTASLNDTIASGGEVQGVSGLRLWGEPHFQYQDDRRSDGLSKINAYSGNRNFVWAADFYALRRLGNNSKTSASTDLGFRVAKMNILRIDIIQNEAYVKGYVPATDSTPSLDVYYYLYRGAESESNSNILFGPILGWSGAIQEGKLRIRGMFTQSFLFGNIDQSGRWIDFSDAWFATMQDGQMSLLTSIERRVTVDPLSGSERVFLPVTELSIDVSFAPRKRIFIGGGVFISAWFNAPVAAGWSASNFDWELRKATPIYAGLLAVTGFRF